MIKKLIFVISLVVALNAGLNTRVQSIVGYQSYKTNKSLINYIIQDKKSFYKNGKANYFQIVSRLKDNGLLKLELGALTYIDVSFNIRNSTFKTITIIKDILKSAGHYYYFTKSLDKKDNTSHWTINLKTEVAIDPLILSKRLALANIEILNIKREGKNWTYDIDAKKSFIYKSKDLVLNENTFIKTTAKPYFIKVLKGKSILFESKRVNKWHPNVVFYDKDLNIIEIFKKNEKYQTLSLDIPLNTKYIKINDYYTLANIKKGLFVTIKE